MSADRDGDVGVAGIQRMVIMTHSSFIFLQVHVCGQNDAKKTLVF